MKGAGFVAAILFLGLSLPGPASAADPTEVLIRKGVDKRRRNDDRGALPLFREAYETSRKPRAAAQLGLCEQALEMWLDAEAHISEALVSQTDAWVSGKRETLESALKQSRKHLARIEISQAPAGASVSINGAFRGKIEDAPFFTGPGAVDVTVQSGGDTFRAKVAEVSEGQAHVVVFAPKAESPSPTSALGGPTEPNPVLLASANNVAPTEPISQSGGAPRLLKWVSLGAGALGLTAGIYGLFQRSSAVSDFNNLKTETGEKSCFLSSEKVVGPGGGPPEDRCINLNGRVSTMTTVTTIGFVAGASLALAGFTLWLLEPSAENSHEAFVCAPNIASHGLSCSSTF